MGQRLSGWVAANRQTIVNSDPVLDLGDVARVLKPTLRSCLSAPLVTDSDLVGVLTISSIHRNAFDEDHQRIVEVIGRQVSGPIKQAFEMAAERKAPWLDESTRPVSRHQLLKLTSSELSQGPCSIVVLEFSSDRRRATEPEDLSATVKAAVDVVRTVLRPGDSVFRYDSHRLIILLPQADSTAADVVVGSIHAALQNMPRRDDTPPAVVSSIARATAPEDGAVLAILLAIAEARLNPGRADGQPSIH